MSHSPSTLKILQWNIWYEAPYEDVVAYLKQVNADVLCLQEVTTDSSYNTGINIPQHLTKALRMEAFYKQCRYARLFKMFFYDGNGIFSKYPIVKTRAEILSSDGIELALQRKITRQYLEATIALPNSRELLTIATTHLSWFFPSKNHIKRRADETRKLNAIIAKKKKNYILAADFNAGPAFQSVKSIASLLQPAETDYRKPTWISKRFSRIGMKRRLDYIFTSHDITIKKFSILDPGPSDHCPLLLEITV